jgi:hypothetical protein
VSNDVGDLGIDDGNDQEGTRRGTGKGSHLGRFGLLAFVGDPSPSYRELFVIVCWYGDMVWRAVRRAGSIRIWFVGLLVGRCIGIWGECHCR